MDNGVWRIRENNELQQLYGELGMLRTIKVVRIKWDGQLRRMTKQTTSKIILHVRPGGRKAKKKVGGECREGPQEKWRKTEGNGGVL